MQVLQSCYDYPGVLEIMVNSYEHLKPTKKWRDAIPDDCYQVTQGGIKDSMYIFVLVQSSEKAYNHLNSSSLAT